MVCLPSFRWTPETRNSKSYVVACQDFPLYTVYRASSKATAHLGTYYAVLSAHHWLPSAAYFSRTTRDGIRGDRHLLRLSSSQPPQHGLYHRASGEAFRVARGCVD